jgi:hypothetical protein
MELSRSLHIWAPAATAGGAEACGLCGGNKFATREKALNSFNKIR